MTIIEMLARRYLQDAGRTRSVESEVALWRAQQMVVGYWLEQAMRHHCIAQLHSNPRWIEYHTLQATIATLRAQRS